MPSDVALPEYWILPEYKKVLHNHRIDYLLQNLSSALVFCCSSSGLVANMKGM